MRGGANTDGAPLFEPEFSVDVECVGARERVSLLCALPEKVSAPLLVLAPLGGGERVRPRESAAELDATGELEEVAGGVREGEAEAGGLPDAAAQLPESCGDNVGCALDALTDSVDGALSEADGDEEGCAGEGVCSWEVGGDWEAEGAPGVAVGALGVPLCRGGAEAQAEALPEPQNEGGRVERGAADGSLDCE